MSNGSRITADEPALRGGRLIVCDHDAADLRRIRQVAVRLRLRVVLARDVQSALDLMTGAESLALILGGETLDGAVMERVTRFCDSRLDQANPGRSIPVVVMASPSSTLAHGVDPLIHRCGAAILHRPVRQRSLALLLRALSRKPSVRAADAVLALLRREQHTQSRQFAAMLDTITDPCGIFSAVRDDAGVIVDFCIDYINLAGAQSNQGRRDEQIGRRLLVVAPLLRELGLFGKYVELVETGKPIDELVTLPAHQGTDRTHFAIRAARAGDGFVAQWRDATAQMRTDRELRLLNDSLERRITERTAEASARAEQLRALALSLADAEARERKRLAQILHDHFQQLLSAAKLKTGMVRRQVTDEPTKQNLLQIERLLADAINESRSLTIELSPPVLYDAGLTAAIEATARNVEQRHGIKINVQCDPAAEPEDEQLRVLLFEAVREMVQNVIEHARARHVSILTRPTDDQQIEIVIQDDGAGFDPSTLAGPQERRPSKFGLMEIRERLSFIGGSMELTSRPGTGTRVRLVAPAKMRKPPPVAIGPPAAAPAAPSPAAGGLVIPGLGGSRKARVLVADDHAMFREGLITLLRQEAFLDVVGEAGDGVQAIELARQLRPDVLIVDLSMPLMNGIEVTRILSLEQPNLRIIGLSMHERQDMANAMRSAGAAAYLTKGGASDALLSVLRSMLPAATERTNAD